MVASWYSHQGERAAEPVVVWLRDDRGGCTFVATGSDWCLIVADQRPHADLDLGEWGRLDVRDAPTGTPSPAPRPPRPRHPPGVHPAHRPHRPRTRLPTGTVRCESWEGDLRLTALPHRPRAVGGRG
ncbi:hypothetical protein [Kitasatospora fiedleri]|uniref:hypothetical protein n=1 Tax=Kitasatospora fiedleri TaxID=2991545 RepID=UPI00249A4E01|nr:hypothetical protein [Kitasatospora fiedleri]